MVSGGRGLGRLNLILAIGNILLELGRRTPTLSLLVLQAAMLLGVNYGQCHVAAQLILPP